MRKILAAFALLVASCSTATTPDGAKVRVTSNAESLVGCKVIGEVQGEDNINPFDDVREENAIRRMKNAAAAMGANTVLVVTASSKGSRQHGEAYRCPAQP
jgi:uncharacterized protein YbjQ (UPF0145 family)